ncbi:hypothetical protein COW36_07615 [bacterium (Candidatus Blackallbacteria) CG17_big_fil_post_rev_8_21_14_2_50_48_46]|uniref:RNA polymerase sigma factor n=1 Tax=bacterium (Candidatus Blackallbacteria) CG17_big_fil_post_rev_8_21_14_2_50_48_46 TaxID=2014261 RepID=A0A2M7G6N9_9BACT|nr:MAG: hypothetical protein COW36_07615 [bacterium (Candidatus Blackallbacteria) CG17_big_fil_post_rev_8_21_14_2_50_48_46]
MPLTFLFLKADKMQRMKPRTETHDLFPHDEDLMLRVLSGDAVSFRQLVQRWKQPLVNFFYRSLGEQESAEELAQEVFIKVWKAKNYQVKAKFSTWLYRLAQHQLIDHWRRMGRRPQRFEPLEQAFELPAQEISPEQRVLVAESRAQVQAAISALPVRQQQVLILSKFQDLKYSQIAEILDCPVNQVKTQVFRAVQSLGKKLKELVHEEA